jgi:hypothetical protein
VDALDGLYVPKWGVDQPLEEASVGQASTIGLDIAKHVFQAHGADASGHVVFRKRPVRGLLWVFLISVLPGSRCR